MNGFQRVCQTFTSHAIHNITIRNSQNQRIIIQPIGWLCGVNNWILQNRTVIYADIVVNFNIFILTLVSHAHHTRDTDYQRQHLFRIRNIGEKFSICVNTLIYASPPSPSPTQLFKMGYGERWVRLQEIIITTLLITLRASMVLCLSTCDKNQYYERWTNRSVNHSQHEILFTV